MPESRRHTEYDGLVYIYLVQHIMDNVVLWILRVSIIPISY